MIGDLRGKNFLDYGCGAGLFAVHAARACARRVVGVDAEPAVLGTASYFAGKEGVADRCAWISSERFSDLDSGMRFDVILLKDVIEHVEDDEALLVSARKRLAPGGRLILSTQNALSLNYLTEGVYRRYLRGDKTWFGWDETHLRFYTFFDLRKKMRRAGWNPLAWRSNYLVPHKFPRKRGGFRRFESLTRIDLLLGGRFPWNRLGWNLIVKAGG